MVTFMDTYKQYISLDTYLFHIRCTYLGMGFEGFE
jgi:hypothetical protein